MQKIKLLMATGMAAFITVSGVSANDGDIDLKLNGDFRGATLGAQIVPGWSVDAAPGTAEIVKTNDADEFAVKVTANTDKAKTLSSNFFAVAGKTLKLETEMQGSGSASVGFTAFDADQKPLADANQQKTYQLSGKLKTKNYFPLADNVKYIKICLAAAPGAQITFSDIEAEFQTAALSIKNPIAAPQIDVATATTLPQLIDDKFYKFSRMPKVEVYQITLPVGSDIEFDLEEDADKNLYWTLIRRDDKICQVKMEHEKGGIWPFRYDKSEIELKAMAPGNTKVIFNCGDKNFIVVFTAI